MRSPDVTKTTRRCCGEDGAVLAEFALMSPFLVLILLGIVEFGTIYRNETTITGAIRNAARADAQMQNNPGGDFAAVTSFSASIGSADNLTIERLVIYEATSSSGAPSSSCKNNGTNNSGAGVSGSCNIYNAWQIANGTSANYQTGSGSCGSGKWDRFWCYDTRKAELAGGNSPPDYLGVYVKATYDSVTGIIPSGSLVVSDYTVTRVEPSIG